MRYLDYNATAPMREEVLEYMIHASAEVRNAMSLHHHGRKARVALDVARDLLRDVLDFPKAEVVYTSGGTEADNLAIFGFARQARAERGCDRLALSPWEHPAVVEPMMALQSEGFQVDLLPMQPDGRLETSKLDSVITPKTALVAVMLAQNETGLILDVASIAQRCHSVGAHLHCDAVQAVGKIPVSAMALGCDSLALSAHKFGGPRGVGALLSLKGNRPAALWLGGGQEEGTRSGTQPGALILGMSKALELSANELPKYAELREKHQIFESRVVDELGLSVIGAGLGRLPNTSSLWIPSQGGSGWVKALSDRGFALSAGAACHAGAAQDSRIHRLTGQSNHALEMIRVSSGLATESDTLGHLADALEDLL